jgi:N,N'-diacetyllegionaminate synthase
MRTCVIAEIASAHDGDLQQAKRLIDAAAQAGATAVKAQYWSDPDQLAARRRAGDRYREIYRRYSIPVGWLPELQAHAETRGLEFLCTTYLPQDVWTVAPFVRRFKVASFEAGDIAFVARHANDRPILVSLGMATVLVDPRDRYAWSQRHRLVFLHCTSSYPAPMVDLNLAVIRQPWCAGLSDHSGLIETGAIAVSAGASILEVHLKLPDTDPENPDAGEFALLPDDLGDYIARVQDVELMLGDGHKRQMPSEAAMAAYRVGV